MKKIFIPAAVIAVTLTTAVAKKNDATLMTVNGKDVKVSEFQYLFQKNNQQQAEPQSLDEYVDMFINYKLKVADAEAAGIDTTAEFIKEFNGYCDDLAKPFLTDSTVVESLRKEAYERMKRNVNVSHIMLPVGQTPDEKLANRNRLDSIRSAILNGADFGDMAVKYSSDRSAVRNRGNMGYITAGKFPYPFEMASFTTPVGQISEVIDDAPYGWHIVKVEAERPDLGQVHARHILKLTRGLSEAEAAAKKSQIDSIYTLLKNGADFADIAVRESEDPGSARQGGMLKWFGAGEMVKEFETAAFELADSAISEPFATSYGYHIVQTLGHRGIGEYDDLVPQIDRSMQNDIRSKAPREAKIAQFRSQYKAKINDKAMAHTLATVRNAGGLDSVSIAQLRADWTTMATVGNKKVLVSDVAKRLPNYSSKVSPEAAAGELSKATNSLLDEATLECAREDLASSDPSYRDLINEYRDGILLFEISNRNVWDKSSKDAEGLEKFFNENRENYKWDAPHYKAIVVSATSDSVAAAAQAYLKENPVQLDSLVTKLRGQFGRNIKVQRMIYPNGENSVIDYLGFGGPKPALNGKWVAFFTYEGEMLQAPTEANDVRAAVVNDYQRYLEEKWLKELHDKYPVKVNEKVLKQLQKEYDKK